MDTDNKCILCGTNCHVGTDPLDINKTYSCNECGTFIVSTNLFGFSSSVIPEFDLISLMYFYQLNYKPANEKTNSFVWQAPSNLNSDRKYIAFGELMALRPQTLKRRLDMILLNLNHMFSFVGQTILIPINQKLIHLFFSNVQNNKIDNNFGSNRTEIIAICTLLAEKDYITFTNTSNSIEIRIIEKGWAHIEDLQADIRRSPQAFIAMWFDPSMEEAREAIKDAVRECKYIPCLIDEKKHNNQIVPEIFYEIDRSQFLIADVTNHRNGVYYEAGYAYGKGKEVIVTCQNKHKKKCHFDIAQKSMIIWEDVADLKKRLIDRIESTVGKYQ